jgi:hypothetical protein
VVQAVLPAVWWAGRRADLAVHLVKALPAVDRTARRVKAPAVRPVIALWPEALPVDRVVRAVRPGAALVVEGRSGGKRSSRWDGARKGLT